MAQTYGSSPLWHRIRTLDRTSLFIQQDEQSDNSLDAKADKIYKYFTNNNELCGLIHFDNGKGMEFPSIIIDPKNMKPHKIVYNNFILNGLTNPMNFNSNKIDFNSNKIDFNSNKIDFNLKKNNIYIK